MKTKTYPLKIDENSYKTLKSICEAKNITIKDGITAAIGLLIAHNMDLVEIKKRNPNKRNDGVNYIKDHFKQILQSIMSIEPKINSFSFCEWSEVYKSRTRSGYTKESEMTNNFIFEPNEIIESPFVKIWEPENEFGIKSSVFVEGKGTMHIPMIDFKEGANIKMVYQCLAFIRNIVFSPIVFETSIVRNTDEIEYTILKTDNSYHLYLNTLLNKEEFKKFYLDMISHSPKTHIDSEWAVKSINRGFACLRWTSNSGVYKEEPKHKITHKFGEDDE